jgi:hypothetical protein
MIITQFILQGWSLEEGALAKVGKQGGEDNVFDVLSRGHTHFFRVQARNFPVEPLSNYQEAMILVKLAFQELCFLVKK